MFRTFVLSGLCALALLCGNTVSAREYRVLVIRVDFPYEDPDHDTTSGRGNFDLGNYYTDPAVHDRYTYPWDVPPHDSLYFSHHLTAFNRYLKTVSEHRDSITWSIWPKSLDGAYRMANKFYKYGNGRTTEETYEKLAGLFSEAVGKCKETEGSSIDFSEYDTFMIIHAGIGQETSGGLNDIASAYLSATDFGTYLGGPLSVDGAQIANGIILPEMIADNGGGGLNGLIAQMFGHRLGLPSLSNNEDGLPAAGGWSLMDTGGLAYGCYSTRGFIPTHPEIWSKIRLGWITPVTVTSDTTLGIAATHVSNGLPRAVRIPITSDEYLLLENRQGHAIRDSVPAVVFSDTDTSGVWMEVAHYDTFIPGSGILIWRINDRIIRENETTGAVNNSRYRRGVDLLEADGVQDIGAIFGYGDLRSNYSEGWEGDTFKTGHHSTLSPVTVPNSGSMWGARSGVTVKVNSDTADVMNVTITFAEKTLRMEGVPCGNGVLTAADLDGDGAEEIISSGTDTLAVRNGATGTTGFLPGSWHPVVIPAGSGTPMLAVARNDSLLFFDASLSLLAMLSLPDSVSAQPVYTEVSSAGHLIVPVHGGTTATSLLCDIALAGFPSCTIDTVSIPAPIKSIAAAEDFFAVLGTNGVLSTGKLAGDNVRTVTLTPDTPVYGPVIADMNRDGARDAAVTLGNRLVMLMADSTTGALAVSAEITLAHTPPGAPAVADMDRDGYPELIVTAGRQFLAFRANGVPVTGFPHTLPPGDAEETITTSPVIADLDTDGTPDIVFGTSDARLMAYDPAGNTVDGYPVTLLGIPCGSPLFFRRSASGDASVAWGDTSGVLFTRTIDGTFADSSLVWPMWRGGAGLGASLANADILSALKTTAAFEVFCYPNPITGGSGTFRITPESTTDCRITVFSAEGKRVFDHYTPESGMIPGVPNEVTMDASRLASGLYIAKIKTRTRTKIYKLGVLK